MELVHHFVRHWLLCSLNYLSLFLITGKVSCSQSEEVILSNHVIISFDPYVSVLDKINKYRYNISDMLPMIAKIHTEFSKIVIEVKEDIGNDPEKPTSLALAPLAVAEYNKMNFGNANFNPLEVWLSFIEPKQATSRFPKRLLGGLQEIADKTNEIFNNTVTLILIPNHMIALRIIQDEFHLKPNELPKLFGKYRFGVMLDENGCIGNLFMSEIIKFQPEVLIAPVEPISSDTTANNLVFTLNEEISKCKKYYSNLHNSVDIVLSVISPDTGDDLLPNYSRLVKVWSTVRQWANDTNVQFVLNKAFDTPYAQTIQSKTAGLWKLAYNFNGTTIKQTDFIDKRNLSLNFKQNTINLTWLAEKSQFDRENFGIIFCLYDEQRKSAYTQSYFVPLLKEIAGKFSKAVVLLDDTTKIRVRYVLGEVLSLMLIKDEIEVIVIVMPKQHIRNFVEHSLPDSANRYGYSLDLLKKYILPYDGHNTFAETQFFRTKMLANVSNSTYKMGNLFPVEICGYFGKLNETEKNYVVKAFREAEVIYFTYEEDQGTVMLGAERMFMERSIILETCRQFIGEEVGESGQHNLEMGFIMLSYYTNQNFYSNTWALIHYVKYWELMSEWAKLNNMTVIMSNALTSKRIIRSGGNSVRDRIEEGWWREVKNENNQSGIFLSKKYEALVAAEKFLQSKEVDSSNDKLEATEIVLIFVGVLLFVVLGFVLVHLKLRNHYRNEYLSKVELKEFFEGTGASTEEDIKSLENAVEAGSQLAQKLAYDKNRYEIPTGSFTIDETKNLGAGEFGLVSRGTIVKNRTAINVAIKTMRLGKPSSSVLSGILSEIKVLAYLGKHENIVELLGANTENLKKGQVFVFLELCQMGSLEKHLSSLRTQYCMIARENKFVTSNDYTNTTNQEILSTRNLEPSVSHDLFRWSREIANGMCYLASKKVVHADLASRNVLLTLDKEAKICDFGLSRRLYDYSNYVKQKQEPLPWRWMPPEALKFLQFNEKSDVWAYGVTLWEMYSLGEKPYPGLSWDLNFADLLEDGLRLLEPKFNDENNLYSLMRECWALNPERRPTFQDILSKI